MKEEGKRAKAFETKIFYGRQKQKIQASEFKRKKHKKVLKNLSTDRLYISAISQILNFCNFQNL